jgi:DNA invertase Pin-like site-specific DNA recombinase
MHRMRAAVYARESKGDLDSRDRQREDAVRLADQRGWQVVLRLGDDDTSAAGKRTRPGFERLLTAVTSGEVEAVVAWSLDRLTRNRRDTVRLIETCQTHGVTLALVRGSDLAMDTPAGRMTADILASVARAEIETKSDRQRRAQIQAAERGDPPSRRAFGYRPGGLEVDPVEGPAVADAFTRLLAGGSLTGITKAWNAAGYRTVGGKPWTAPAVRALIRNGRYAAIRMYRRQEVGPGNWPAIVPEQTWRAAVALLDDPARRATLQGQARRWLGASYYTCGRCGSPMTVGYRRKGGHYRRVYRCRQHLGHLTRVADPIDDYVREVIVARLRRPDLANLLAEPGPDVGIMRAEARTLRLRIEQLADDIDLDEITLARRVRALRSRQDEIRAQLAAAGRTGALVGVLGAPDPGAAWLCLDVAAQQAVARAIATVTLLPAPARRGPFDEGTVDIIPKDGTAG